MKLKEKWELTEMEGEYVVVPTENNADGFCGIVRLNETGKDIWLGLAEGLDEDAIAARLTESYAVDLNRAKKAVKAVIEKLTAEGLIEE